MKSENLEQIFQKSAEKAPLEKRVKKYNVKTLENINESDEELHDSVFSPDEVIDEKSEPEKININLIKLEQLKYVVKRRKINEEKSNNFSLYRAKEKFINNHIKCVKYNYSLEEKVQNFCTFDAFI